MNIKNIKLAVIGLGYVGLPLALEFSKKREVVGYDIKKKRIQELKLGIDTTAEVLKRDLIKLKNIKFTYFKKDLRNANCFIITVPTPIYKNKKPDLRPLIKATQMVSDVLKMGDLIIYESTVFPGCTEDVCVPILEKRSGLKFNKDFFCGYSPERNNPGDKLRKITSIKKITSGSTLKISNLVDALYRQIIFAGTHKAPNIKVAEAAKVIENVQRDLNIGLINELSILLNKMNIDTQEVLEAAGSKWNFIPFRPGLVGGHCIGVDPYYLIDKAKKVGQSLDVVSSARKINDGMGDYVASMIMTQMKHKFIKLKNSKILIMGLTFKENCPDLRNSGVSNVIKKLKKFSCKLDLYDPWANKYEVKKIYGVFPINKPKSNFYDGIILAVSHDIFKKMKIKNINNLRKKNSLFFDLKHLFPKEVSDFRL